MGLDLVVLFGSRATGRPPPSDASDVDLAVRAAPGSRVQLWDCYLELSKLFSDGSLDLVLLNGADPLLRYEVMRDGIRIHGDPLDFLEYRAFAYREFVDSADLRELEDALFRKKMEYLRGVLHGPA